MNMNTTVTKEKKDTKIKVLDGLIVLFAVSTLICVSWMAYIYIGMA